MRVGRGDGERRRAENRGGDGRDDDAGDDDVAAISAQIVASSSQVDIERAPERDAVQRQRLRAAATSRVEVGE